jgi:hypothetical protein
MDLIAKGFARWFGPGPPSHLALAARDECHLLCAAHRLRLALFAAAVSAVADHLLSLAPGVP